jgi:iron complex transport system ATP-binding protein
MSAARLVTTDVSVSLGGKSVVQHASLRLEAGHFVALVGPNGAGKTSLLRAIAGLIPATGTIMLEGKNLSDLSMRERAKRIAYLPQGHAVHWPLAARDVVALGRYPHGVNDPARMLAPDLAIVREAMARTHTLEFADRPVQSLSGGEKARVMLARVFAMHAPLLLADEPTAALDPHHQIAIMQALKDEAKAGSLVIAVTHDIGLAARLADALILIDKGRIMAQGAPEAVLTPENLADVYGINAYIARHDGQPVILPWGITSP